MGRGGGGSKDWGNKVGGGGHENPQVWRHQGGRLLAVERDECRSGGGYAKRTLQ